MSDISGGKQQMSELKLRIFSGVIMAALAALSVILGGWFFAVFWGFAAVAVAFEWQRLVHGKTNALPVLMACLAAVAATLAAVTTSMVFWLAIPVLVLVTGLLGPSANRHWAALGVVYAAGLGAAAVLCRGEGYDGAVVLFWLFGVVWGTDTLAYFTGRALGGPKLWPSVSPKKTWSGAVGGLVGGVAIAGIILLVAGFSLMWQHVLISCALSVLTQAGDLFESSIKRRFGVKDAGTLIPGHGGVMDRLDGFIFAVIFEAIVGAAHAGLHNVPAGLLYWP